MKGLTIVIAAILSTACSVHPDGSLVRDQCMRQEIFMACLKQVPQGQKQTVTNDWAEVIGECESVAYYQSLRREKFVKPESRLAL